MREAKSMGGGGGKSLGSEEIVEEEVTGRKEERGTWRKMREKVRIREWCFGFSFWSVYCFNVIHSSR